MKIWAVALISMMLVCCATTPVPLHTERLFRDHLFAVPPARISADDVFAFNDDMKQYLSTHIASQFAPKIGIEPSLTRSTAEPAQAHLRRGDDPECAADIRRKSRQLSLPGHHDCRVREGDRCPDPVPDGAWRGGVEPQRRHVFHPAFLIGPQARGPS